MNSSLFFDAAQVYSISPSIPRSLKLAVFDGTMVYMHSMTMIKVQMHHVAIRVCLSRRHHGRSSSKQSIQPEMANLIGKSIFKNFVQN